MDFQFIIPHTNAELQNSNGNNYFVKQVHDKKDLMNLLKDAKTSFGLLDPFYIFDHFDTFYSMIEHGKSVQIPIMDRASDLLYLTIDKLGQKLSTYLQNNELNDRNSYLNLTKMTIYLMIGIVRCIDEIVIGADDAGAKKLHGRKQNADSDFDWDSKRFRILLQMYNFVQLPLEKLWSQSIAEEDFVNLFCDLGYRTLEHPTIKENRVNDVVFQMFGTAIKRYNHAMVFPIRILQILRASEIAVQPIAHGVQLLHEEYDIKTIFSILLTDLIQSLEGDAADNQTSKQFSLFLIELGMVAPKEIMPHLSQFGEELLNLEAYTIRNSVLEIMGHVVTTELSSEELSDELKEIREIFLEDLSNHMMDISAHVRSKVLQIWNHMKSNNSVPLAWQNKILQLTSERLDDKATLVRKHAVHLIKAFLELNPFAAKLSLSELKESLEKEIDKLQSIRNKMIDEEKKKMEFETKWEEIVPDLMLAIQENLQNSQDILPAETLESEFLVSEVNTLFEAKEFSKLIVLINQADQQAGNLEARTKLTFEQQCAFFAQLIKSYLYANVIDHSEEFTTQDQTVKFLKDSIEFCTIIAETVPKIENMLMSKINTDVFEAIDFFTTAYLFGIKGTECGMRKMLFLVWIGDKEKHDAVAKAYHRILFGTDQTGRAHAIKVVDNLCTFFENISIGHFTAMEVLMQEWIKNNHIDSHIIQVMFERFTMKLTDTSKNKARLSLQLLCMLGKAKQSIATANIEVVQSICFEESQLEEPKLFVTGLEFLSNLISPNQSTKYYKRYDDTNSFIDSALRIFKQMFFVPELKNFDAISIKTLDLIYRLCQAPDLLVQNFILDLYADLKQISQSNALADDTNNNDSITLPDYLWARFIFVFGYIAIKEMIFLDIDVYNNMKYRQELMEEKKNLKKNNKRKTVTAANINMSASSALKRLSGSAAEPQQEPDEMLVGATAEDSIAEMVNLICESELLFSPNAIFQKIIPIIMEILKYPSKYRSTLMQQSACLALIHFMSVSSKFCETNMQFLMGILSATKNINIKCNIVIGLSDLTFRFPNIIEPWTQHFYSTLHETDVELRLTAVKMISHLILHEMIRVKGQISELGLCIVDENDEIRNTTQQFFKEIAHKSNILYNVLPDIISRLSSNSMPLEEEKYRFIMKYIMSLIHKDRQVESLVEKLCLRFRVANDVRQWRDIAYCLTLLNYTEKTIKKLIDNIQCFKDKVQEDEVYECFKTIITNTLRLAKPELKSIIVDFETKLKECFNIQQPNEESNATTNDRATQRRSFTEMPPPRKPPKRGRKVVAKKKPTHRINDSDSDDDDDNGDFEVRNNYTPTKTPTTINNRPTRRRVSNTATVRDSSSSSSDEDHRPNKNTRSKRQK